MASRCYSLVPSLLPSYSFLRARDSPRKLAETSCHARPMPRCRPAAARKLYHVRKRTIEIGYLPNRSTLLSASRRRSGRTDRRERSRGGRRGIYFPPIGIDLVPFWRWQPEKLHLAESIDEQDSTRWTNRLPLPLPNSLASSLS